VLWLRDHVPDVEGFVQPSEPVQPAAPAPQILDSREHATARKLAEPPPPKRKESDPARLGWASTEESNKVGAELVMR
jgi:hypothetical protein